MLFTISNMLCDSQDRHSSASHFVNRLPFVIEIDKSKHFVRLEGISITPWPGQPVIIYCNLCDHQPIGKNFAKVLSMTYEREKYTRTDVPTQLGRYQEIEIHLKTMDGEDVDELSDVIIQFSIDQSAPS